MQKKIAIVLGVILLALVAGYFGSQWLGSPHRPEDVAETAEERAERLGLGADVNADEAGTTADLAPVEARPLTGDEGNVVDGVRQLAPNEPARVDNQDYFDGLEEMNGAESVVDNAPAAAATDTPATPAAPVVERPDDDLMNEIDALEGGQ